MVARVNIGWTQFSSISRLALENATKGADGKKSTGYIHLISIPERKVKRIRNKNHTLPPTDESTTKRLTTNCDWIWPCYRFRFFIYIIRLASNYEHEKYATRNSKLSRAMSKKLITLREINENIEGNYGEFYQ